MRRSPKHGPLRIAFGINMEIGGTELNAIRTAERLDRDRFQVLAVYGEDGPLVDRYLRSGIPLHRFPLKNLYGIKAARQGLRLARFLTENQIDVFHSHDVYNNIFGLSCARLARVPVTIASRRWWYTVPRPILNRLNRWSSMAATCALANSPSVGRLLAKEGVSLRRIAVVPNFLDESAFLPVADSIREGVLQELRIPADVPIVGCVANLTPVKDHMTLVRAAARIRASGPEVHVVLLGEGPCRSAIEDLIRELRLEDIVHLPGQWIRSWNLHGLFDISVLCSTSEGFPNSIVEAMGAGRPVVATGVGGNVDAVLDGETGFLFPPGDVEGLSRALKGLLGDPGLRRRLGERARSRALTDYSASKVISDLECLYESLVARGVRPPFLDPWSGQLMSNRSLCAE